MCQGRLKCGPVAPVEKWATPDLHLSGDAGPAKPVRLGPRLMRVLLVVPGGAGEVAVFEAVAVAFEGEDLGVVDEPVDHRGGDDVVAEDLAPGR